MLRERQQHVLSIIKFDKRIKVQQTIVCAHICVESVKNFPSLPSHANGCQRKLIISFQNIIHCYLKLKIRRCERVLMKQENVFFVGLDNLSTHKQNSTISTRKSALTKIHNWKSFFHARALFYYHNKCENIRVLARIYVRRAELITRNIKYAFIHHRASAR